MQSGQKSKQIVWARQTFEITTFTIEIQQQESDLFSLFLSAEQRQENKGNQTNKSKKMFWARTTSVMANILFQKFNFPPLRVASYFRALDIWFFLHAKWPIYLAASWLFLGSWEGIFSSCEMTNLPLWKYNCSPCLFLPVSPPEKRSSTGTRNAISRFSSEAGGWLVGRSVWLAPLQKAQGQPRLENQNFIQRHLKPGASFCGADYFPFGLWGPLMGG